jgi:hypothetical protein
MRALGDAGLLQAARRADRRVPVRGGMTVLSCGRLERVDGLY